METNDKTFERDCSDIWWEFTPDATDVSKACFRTEPTHDNDLVFPAAMLPALIALSRLTLARYPLSLPHNMVAESYCVDTYSPNAVWVHEAGRQSGGYYLLRTDLARLWKDLKLYAPVTAAEVVAFNRGLLNGTTRDI